MTKPLKIIQVINVRWFNATAWYAVYLGKLLKEAGHESLILALPGTHPCKKAEEWGLDVRARDLNRASPAALAGNMAFIRRLVGGFRPDVINCHRGESFILWGLLRKMRGDFALVRTRGDQRPPSGGVFNRWLHGGLSDAVIATNSAMSAHMRRRLDIPDERLHTIIGGVDRELFRFCPAGREQMRRGLGFGDQDFVIGLLGRFDPVKGHFGLLEAAARVLPCLSPERARRVKLLFVGREANIPVSSLLGRAEALGLADRLRIITDCPDISACISAFDAGVVNSLGSEAIARAALEIMSCKIPLAGTTVGVMPDLLPVEALVRPGDEGELSKMLGRLIEEPDFRSRLQDDARQRMDGLSSEAFLGKTLEVYRKALARAGGRAL